MNTTPGRTAGWPLVGRKAWCPENREVGQDQQWRCRALAYRTGGATASRSCETFQWRISRACVYFRQFRSERIRSDAVVSGPDGPGVNFLHLSSGGPPGKPAWPAANIALHECLPSNMKGPSGWTAPVDEASKPCVLVRQGRARPRVCVRVLPERSWLSRSVQNPFESIRRSLRARR